MSPNIPSTGRQTKKPIIAQMTPVMSPTMSDECTESETAFGSRLPRLRATTTFVPTEKPMNMLRIRFIMAVVVPMEPIAPSTLDLPAIIISAAL